MHVICLCIRVIRIMLEERERARARERERYRVPGFYDSSDEQAYAWSACHLTPTGWVITVITGYCRISEGERESGCVYVYALYMRGSS